MPDFDGDAVRRVHLGTLASESIVSFPTTACRTASPRTDPAGSGSRSGPAGPSATSPGRRTAGWAPRSRAPGSASRSASRWAPTGGCTPRRRARPRSRASTPRGRVQRYATPGGKPWQIIAGADEDLYFTDVGSPRILRFVNGAPRAATGAVNVLAATAASVAGQVDARGNETQVVFDYGTTTAYGSTTAPLTVARGVGNTDVRADLPSLEPGTTYHVRVRATNAEGAVTGTDATFTTPLPPPTPVRAAVSFRWGFTSSFTILTRVRVRQVARQDKIKLTCKGRGCGVKKRTVRNKQGTVKFTKHFGAERRLRKGTKVRLRITAPNRIGAVVTLKVRKGKDPKITRRCTLPGSSKPRKRCSAP